MYGKPPAAPVPNGGDAFGEAHRTPLGPPPATAPPPRLPAASPIQWDLPSVEPPAQPQQATDFAGSLPFLQSLFWVAVAATVLFLAYLIVQRLQGAEWPRRRRAGEEEAAAADWRPEAGEAR